MRKLSLVAALLVLVLTACSAQTRDAVDVGYTKATVVAAYSWSNGDGPGEFWVEYRQVGTQPWRATDHRAFPEMQGSGTHEERFVVFGLKPGTQYEYRACGVIPEGSACYDRNGAANGTDYTRFTTRTLEIAGAQPVRSFADSLGVNTRTGFQATDTSWHQAYKDALAYAGFVGIRDGLHGPTPGHHPSQRQFFRDLAALGYKNLLGVGGLDFRDQMPAKVNEYATDAVMRSGMMGVESANEPDLFTTGEHCPQPTDPWWVCMRWFQNDLFQRVNNSALANLPVLAPSYAHDGASQVGNLDASADAGNIHPYPGGGRPGPAAEGDIANKCRKTVSAPKPCYATEVGYHTAWQTPPEEGHDGVPPDVRASYTLRLYMKHYQLGIPRTDLWSLRELCGEPTTVMDFGIFNCDWARRHVADAIHNLTRQIDHKATAVAPQIVGVGFDNAPPDLQHLILRHPDGSYRMLLWRDVSIWNRTTRQRITVPPVRVEVGFPHTSAQRYNPVAAEGVQETMGDRISVLLAGDPVVLTIR